MAAATKTPAKKRKKPAVSGKQAVHAAVKYEIIVDCKTRFYDAYDASQSSLGAWGKTRMIVEQVGKEVRIRMEDCETQIQLHVPTVKALLTELEKTVEVK